MILIIFYKQMKINFLQLIVGLVVGVILVGLLYYGAYYLFEKYQRIRHPFKRSSHEKAPPPSPTTLSLSESINTPSDICDNEYIMDRDVFLKVNGKALAVDETLSKVITKPLNLTDKYQKWRIIFYKDPNNPFGKSQGFIYNIGCDKYLSFENSILVLKDMEEPIDIKCPVDNFRVELVHFQNQLSNLDETVFLELQNGNKIISTSDRKKASDFFVTYL
jgi:hypothetical protein